VRLSGCRCDTATANAACAFGVRCDPVRGEQETELRRLEGWDGVTAGDGRCSSPCAAARSCEQAGAAALAMPRGEVEGRGGGSEAREALVTGYAEHRASLSEKKNYRRAVP